MRENTLKFPFMYHVDSNYLRDEFYEFENYESKVDTIDIDDTEGLRSIIREIPLDDYKPSWSNKKLLEMSGQAYKESTVNEDELIALVQKLRRDNNGTGKSNLLYMADKKVDFSNAVLKACHKRLMDEKKQLEDEYYGDTESNDNGWVPFNESYSNGFLDEISELK